MKFCLHVHFFDQAQISAPPRNEIWLQVRFCCQPKYGHLEGQMAPREAREVALFRKSDELNSAAKIFGLKVDTYVIYCIFMSLESP